LPQNRRMTALLGISGSLGSFIDALRRSQR
jgi:hypothetical protein